MQIILKGHNIIATRSKADSSKWKKIESDFILLVYRSINNPTDVNAGYLPTRNWIGKLVT